MWDEKPNEFTTGNFSGWIVMKKLLRNKSDESDALNFDVNTAAMVGDKVKWACDAVNNYELVKSIIFSTLVSVKKRQNELSFHVESVAIKFNLECGKRETKKKMKRTSRHH